MWHAASVLVWNGRRKHGPSLEHGPPVLPTAARRTELSKTISAPISQGRLRHFARRKPPIALAAAPVDCVAAAFGPGFRLSGLKPRLACLFEPFLSATYTTVARGAPGEVENRFVKAGQPDYNLLILLEMVIRAGFPVKDNFNDSYCFRRFPE